MKNAALFFSCSLGLELGAPGPWTVPVCHLVSVASACGVQPDLGIHYTGRLERLARCAGRCCMHGVTRPSLGPASWAR